jgi:hypothetical protein
LGQQDAAARKVVGSTPRRRKTFKGWKEMAQKKEKRKKKSFPLERKTEKEPK